MLAIPPKRTDRNLVTYLTEAEVDALLAASDHDTWTGRRDHAMLALTVQTGLRISELTGLTSPTSTLTTGANVHYHRQRPQGATHAALAAHRAILRAGSPNAPRRAMRSAVPDHHRPPPQPRRDRTAPRPPPRHRPRPACPSLRAKQVTMHTLRHTAAMRLLLAGNDVTVIALWLGHEQLSTRPTSTCTPT